MLSAPHHCSCLVMVGLERPVVLLIGEKEATIMGVYTVCGRGIDFRGDCIKKVDLVGPRRRGLAGRG